MSFSFETFAWAVSALFQLLTVCAYLLSFPDVDGVDDQLPDMPEVIQDSAIEMKITYSGIIFVFGFYTQEARAAAAAVEDKIKKAIVTDDVKRDWYNAELSEMSDEPGSEWMADLPDVGPETVGELALVDVDNRKLAMALTGASQYYNARRTLWLWKGAAVALLGEKLADNPPPMEKHAERPAKHQQVPDGVANRFVPWLIG